MVRRTGIFSALRRRRTGIAAVLVYALLINVLIAGLANAQVIAATLDPLTAAATCDSPSDSGHAPDRHSGPHQPDCTLCGPACSMAAPTLGLGGVAALAVVPASVVAQDRVQATAGIHARSVYRSDTVAQAPPHTLG